MELLNRVLRSVVALLLAPFADLPPLVGLMAAALVVSFGMLLVFRAVSDQKGLDGVKRQIHAGLFEMRLFSHDLRAILGAQNRVLRHNLSYLRLSLLPMIWILPVLILILVQFDGHFGYRALAADETVVVTARLEPTDQDARPEVELVGSPGVRVETPGVWVPVDGEIAWRVRVLEPGRHTVTVRYDGQEVIKEVPAETGVRRRSPLRPRASSLDQLLHPSEAAVPRGGGVTAVRLALPTVAVGVLGLDVHWLVGFFVLTVVFILLLRRPLGVVV